MTIPAVGFRNGDLILKNITFDYKTNPQPAQPGVITFNTDGQLLIGSLHTTPNIAMTAGNLVCMDGTVTISYQYPNLVLSVPGGGGGGSLTTLTGNTGGAIPPLAANINLLTANTTVKVAGVASTNTLTMDFGLSNLLLGASGSITTGGANTGLGDFALGLTTVGGSNCALGTSALQLNTTGGNNIAVGANSLSNFNSGGVASIVTSNVSVGTNSLNMLLTGVSNTCLGDKAGFSYTGSESSNILIGSMGVVGESHTMRIGNSGSGAGQQNRAFHAGVYGVTVAASVPVGIDPNGQLNTLGAGTAGQVLTSNGAGSSPTWQISGAGTVISLTGNTGGAIPPSAGNINIITSNTTVKVAGTSGTSTLLMNFGISNLLLGSSGSITSGTTNNAVGVFALGLNTVGVANCAFGSSALSLNTGGGSNVALGNNALLNYNPGGLFNTATFNVCAGTNALSNLTSGTNNTALGDSSGLNYTGGESSNILIGSQGVAAESNTIRIGATGSSVGQQNRAFHAGVYGVTVAASVPVGIDPNGQLNTLGAGTAGQVLTSNGAGSSPTWQASGGGGSITLTPDTGGVVSPTAGNINVLGLPILAGQTVHLQSQTMKLAGTSTLQVKAPNCALFIVDANPLYGTHTTISSAANDAANYVATFGKRTTIFIRPGTYTENVTLAGGVNLAAYTCDSQTPNVIFLGTISLANNAVCSITGLAMQTNGAPIISLTAGSQVLNINDCVFSVTNAVAMFISGFSDCNVNGCTGFLFTSSFSYFQGSGGGSFAFWNCAFYNSPASQVQNTFTGGAFDMHYCYFQCPITIQAGLVNFSLSYSYIASGGGINTTALAYNATSGTAVAYKSLFDGGSNASITVGAGAALRIVDATVTNSGSSAISGAGSISYDPIRFSGSASNITVASQTPTSFGPRIQLSGGPQLMAGAGSPVGVVTAPQGSYYVRSDGNLTNNRAYINTNGGSSWTAVITAS